MDTRRKKRDGLGHRAEVGLKTLLKPDAKTISLLTGPAFCSVFRGSPVLAAAEVS